MKRALAKDQSTGGRLGARAPHSQSLRRNALTLILQMNSTFFRKELLLETPQSITGIIARSAKAFKKGGW